MSARIFISYRRDDARVRAERLYDRLRERFDENDVFMDVFGIKPGEDFRTIISGRVGSAEIALVVIGPKWLTLEGSYGRRLHDRNDVVRFEIATALKQKLHVVPVLVEGARMPARSDLPRSVAALASLNAVSIADDYWRQGVDELIRELETAMKPRVPPWSVEVPADAPPFPSDEERAAKVSGLWADILSGSWLVRISHPTGASTQGSLAVNNSGLFHGRMTAGGKLDVIAGRLRFEAPDQLILEGETNDGRTLSPFRWAFTLKPGSRMRVVGTNPDGGDIVWTRTG